MIKPRKQKDGRIVRLPAFGRALHEARGGVPIGTFVRKLTLYSAALAKVDQARVEHHEGGEVLHPDALLIGGWAAASGTDHKWLMNVLRWNREHPGERDAPENLNALQEEGSMRVSSQDRDLLRRFHRLSATAQTRLFEQLQFEEFKLGGADGPASTFPAPRVAARGKHTRR